MAYAEKRGKGWRARWRSPDGTLESKAGFPTCRAAERYAQDQEAGIRGGTYVDPKASQITLTEWINRWYLALDLELNAQHLPIHDRGSRPADLRKPHTRFTHP